jgi:CheY-like chemotaxis protein
MNEALKTKEGELKGKTILLVDDEELIRKHSSFPLRAQGATVVMAQNGQEAFGIIQESIKGNIPTFDLIITDYGMPIMDGEELLIALAEDAKTKNIPFIFASGALGDEEREHLLRYPQVKSTLQKPFEFKELVAAAKEALE